MSKFMNVNVVYHYVKDWDRAKKFYDEILGWQVAWSDDNSGWREYGADNATHFAINKITEHARGRQGVGATVTFTVDNVDETHAWLKSKGIKVDDVLLVVSQAE